MPQEKQAAGEGYYLGFDGGGTKTDCILMDATGAVLARASAGPSNPLRAEYAKAWFTLSDAADMVLERQHIKADNIHGICAGIGGAGREAVAKRIAPRARVVTLREKPAEAAAQLAIRLGRRKAHAG
jgi:N-acetylglucosamine kinase-like BadF-type ATPase